MNILIFENNIIKIKAWDYETSTSWGHKCEIHAAGCFAEEKRIYYNRTWEKWQFENVIMGGIDKLIIQYRESERDKILKESNKKRLTKTQNEKIKKDCEKLAKTLKEKIKKMKDKGQYKYICINE